MKYFSKSKFMLQLPNKFEGAKFEGPEIRNLAPSNLAPLIFFLDLEHKSMFGKIFLGHLAFQKMESKAVSG